MKKTSTAIKTAILLIMTVLCVHVPVFALSFVSTSRLAEGKWVKIAVPATGVYAISYETLRKAGFSDPEKVALFGRGAEELPMNLEDASGNPLVEDDLMSVPVKYADGKIIFYGIGPEKISWSGDTQSPFNGRFINSGLNFYSDKGYYFLSDSCQGSEISEDSPLDRSDLPEINEIYSYCYYENDMNLGPNNSGHELWGEDFLPADSRSQVFPVVFPGFSSPHDAVMECKMMAGSFNELSLTYGLNRGSAVETYFPAPPLESTFAANAKTYGTVRIGSKRDKVLITVSDKFADCINLDYFIISYRRKVQFEDGENQVNGFADVKVPSVIKTDKNLMAWDVSDPRMPVSMQYGEGGFQIKKSQQTVIFDPASIDEPEILGDVPNQNLHGLQADPEMIIIAPEEMMASAAKMVDFHAGIGNKVIAVSATDIYNEFSSGRPDPMAYRLFAKMMYERPGSNLKAILLAGQVLSNPKKKSEPFTTLILLQNESGARIMATCGLLDAYGMLDSYYYGNIANRDIHLAVGVLPFNNDAEVDFYLGKLSRFLSADDYSAWADNFLLVADDNNDGLHMLGAEKVADKITEDSSGRMRVDKNYLSELGHAQMYPYFAESLNQGALLSVYLGHSENYALGSSMFLPPPKVRSLANGRLGFMLCCGCLTTNYECRNRGVAEDLIFSTEGGLVGALLTVREVWVHENLNYALYFTEELFQRDVDASGRSRTIGEIMVAAKNKQKSINKLSYHLMCDPLLRLPVPIAGINTEMPSSLNPGTEFDIKGEIDIPESESFNGTAVIKWYAPEYSQPTKSLFSNDVVEHEVHFEQDIVETQTVEVRNGQFEASLVCPHQLSQYKGNAIKFSVTAFDSRKFISASYVTKVNLDSSSIMPADRIPPVVESMALDCDDPQVAPSDVIASIEISDDTGLRSVVRSLAPSIILTLDGQELGLVSEKISVSEGGKRIKIDYPLSGLQPGNHEIGVRTLDYAGNETVASLGFNVVDLAPLSSLIVPPGVMYENVEFSLPDESVTWPEFDKLIIRDNKGGIIRSIEYPSLVWDLCDNGGNRVPRGLYKAYLVFDSLKSSSLFTVPVRVPVF